MKTKHLLSGVAVIAALAIRRASFSATSQSVGWKLDGYAGSQPRRAGSDAV